MRELRAVCSMVASSELFMDRFLKARILLFDAIHVVYLENRLKWAEAALERNPSAESLSALADVRYLIDRGFLIGEPEVDAMTMDLLEFDRGSAEFPNLTAIVTRSVSGVRWISERLQAESYDYSLLFSSDEIGLMPYFDRFYDDYTERENSPLGTVLDVALNLFPVPDESVSLEEVFEFKARLADKKWALRRFLKNLATKPQGESEVRDELEWMINEYQKAMEIYHMKASHSFIDVFVVTPLEIIENIVKFNWSKLAKGALQVRKRTIELLDAEMRAPGRECAYIVEAQRHF